MQTKINYLAVVACMFVNIGLGMVWYGPLFADKWMQYNGLSTERVESMPFGFMPYIVSMVGALISGFVLSLLFRRMGVTGWQDGLKTGVAIGLFPLIITFMSYAFSLRPTELSFIDGGYAFVLFSLYGAVIGSFFKR